MTKREHQFHHRVISNIPKKPPTLREAWAGTQRWFKIAVPVLALILAMGVICPLWNLIGWIGGLKE